jgi:hypothetical protein
MVNLVGISYIYKGLVFMLLACSALSLVYLIYRSVLRSRPVIKVLPLNSSLQTPAQ